MADDSSLGARLVRQKALPLFTCNDPAIGIGVLEALHAGGMRVVEFTNRSAGALEVFRALVSEAARRLPEMVLGLGIQLGWLAVATVLFVVGWNAGIKRYSAVGA
jgi:2-dehydro-3-deoxyphosphogluconate aldolase/(4S)-4-hydroxy-2-oxoglutarate aldolase